MEKALYESCSEQPYNVDGNTDTIQHIRNDLKDSTQSSGLVGESLHM